MAPEYAARLIHRNGCYHDSDGYTVYKDTVAIYRNGVRVDLITVDAVVGEDPDYAIVKAIGSHDFEWVY